MTHSPNLPRTPRWIPNRSDTRHTAPKRLMRRAISGLCLSLIALAGCGDDECVTPLGCEGECPSLEESRAEVESPNCREGICPSAVFTCDDLTAVAFDGGYTAEVRYFDAAGRLVAIYHRTDALGAACGADTWGGQRVDCEQCTDGGDPAAPIECP